MQNLSALIIKGCVKCKYTAGAGALHGACHHCKIVGDYKVHCFLRSFINSCPSTSQFNSIVYLHILLQTQTTKFSSAQTPVRYSKKKKAMRDNGFIASAMK